MNDKELLALWLDRQKKIMQRISNARYEKTIKDVEKALNFEWKINGNWLNCKFIFNGAKYLFDGFLDGAKAEIVFGIEKFLREV